MGQRGPLRAGSSSALALLHLIDLNRALPGVVDLATWCSPALLHRRPAP
jgi:hypothetical protein